jgi:para-aminobenzoate synthetase component I
MISDYWVIKKHGEDHLQVTVLSANSTNGPDGESFCILPYQNPAANKIQVIVRGIVGKKLMRINQIQSKEPGTFVLTASMSREKYIKTISVLKQHIQEGTIYEINYCMEFYAENVTIDPVMIFIRLQQLTKAPYAQLVKNGRDYIISASPELFLKREGGLLYTKPIKGTIRRGKNPEEDFSLSDQLRNNIKERTENVMAVDVARNDLSRVAARGSVSVNKLYNIETFETVHQMVSTVSCRLKENTTFDDIVTATFPMASMTGAPKIKAMELIDETEAFKRNYYSGAMGFIDANGDFELSVNIRSIFYNEETKRLSIAVGSAITHLCDPRQEYEECLLKANALLRALNASITES